MSRRAAALLLPTALALSACFRPEAAPVAGPPYELGEAVQFSFGTLEGGEVSSDTTRGRTTALLFVTTYDLPSQAQALLLRDVVATHRPRANGAVIMMEPPRAAPLAQVWADSLALRLPVAMASPSLLAGDGPLGRVDGVPTVLVLDRRGLLVARRGGAQTREQLVAALAEADAR